MGLHVCNGAATMCTFGMAPSALTVLPINKVLTNNMPAANIMDHKPMVNIMPFGTCMSLANPTVAAATATACGVLTPMPCIPNTPAPWMVGAPTVLEASAPVLNETSKLACLWAGVISITYPGQVNEIIP